MLRRGGAIIVSLEMAGTDSYTTSLNTNLAGLGLNIQTHGGVSVGLGYDVRLGFELSKTQGFLVLLNPDSNGNEFNFQVHAGLNAGTTLQAKLFFLNVSATNETTTDNGVGTALNANLGLSLPTTGGVSVSTPSGNQTGLTVNQFVSAVAISVTTAQANAAADINLHLEADVDPNLPNIQADLTIHFPLVSSGSGGINQVMGEPTAAQITSR